MKHIAWAGVGVALAVLWGGFCLAADPVDRTETWSGGSLGAWSGLRSDAVITNSGDSLVAQFEAASQLVPEYERCIAWATHDSSILITNLSFQFRADPRPPSELALYIHSAHSDTVWQKQLDIPLPGGWQSYDVDMAFSEGWSRGPLTTYERFRNDVLNIDWVGVFMVRSAGTEAMEYGLDNFRVRGWQLTDVLGDADENGNSIADAWEEEHDLLGVDPDGDEDSDGMSNYAEWRAGTDPTNALSRFVISAESRLLEAVDVGVAVKWDSIRYRDYTVWKSTNLLEGFSPEASVFSDPPQNQFIDGSATNRGPYFYRVTVDD